jgi:hypothetical protein
LSYIRLCKIGAVATSAETRQAYDDERRLLIGLEREAAQSLDKNTTAISAGALALSITFLHDIAPSPQHTAILVAAWALLSVSLLVVLLSFLTSQLGMRKAREALDALMRDDEPGTNVWEPITMVANVVSILALVFGLGCLGWFAVANLP